MTQETKPLPRIAQRAIALVNVELQKTILEAAALQEVNVNLDDGWRLNADMSAFVKDDKPKGTDGDAPK